MECIREVLLGNSLFCLFLSFMIVVMMIIGFVNIIRTTIFLHRQYKGIGFSQGKQVIVEYAIGISLILASMFILNW